MGAEKISVKFCSLKIKITQFPTGFHLKFFRIIAVRCGSVVVREREREIGIRTARRGPKRCGRKKKQRGGGVLYLDRK